MDRREHGSYGTARGWAARCGFLLLLSAYRSMSSRSASATPTRHHLRVHARVIRCAADIFAGAVTPLLTFWAGTMAGKDFGVKIALCSELGWEPPIGIEPTTYALRGGLTLSRVVRRFTRAQFARLPVPVTSKLVQCCC